MYTLIGSVTSPYVRKLRLFFAQANLSYEFKSINYLEENDAKFLKNINPINKIPILLVGDQPIYDSRVIYNYLVLHHNVLPLTLEQENYLSAIDGAMDTSINLFSLRRAGLDIHSGNAYLERQLERVPLILNYLSPWVKSLNANNPEDWNFVTMSLYSYLFWGEFRDILDLSNFPEMKKFLVDFQNKIAVAETTIKA
jgi:glutathione S-transferase